MKYNCKIAYYITVKKINGDDYNVKKNFLYCFNVCSNNLFSLC